MPYTFTLPGFFSGNVDDFGRALLRKGFGGFPGMRDSRRGPPSSGSNLIDQLFPSGFGGPSRPTPPRPPRDRGDSGSIGGFSNISGNRDSRGRDSGGRDSRGFDYGGGDSIGKGSISSLPKIKQAVGKTSQLIYRIRGDVTTKGTLR